MGVYGASRSSCTMNSIWKVRGRRPTLRRTCKVYIPRNLKELDTLRIPATYEEDHFLVRKLKAFTKHKLHHCILVAIISIYVYAGALLFQYLESHCYQVNSLNISEVRESVLEQIYNESQNGVDLDSEWMANLRRILHKHELLVIEYENAGYGPDMATREKKGISIESAIFFCFTVITTIGYGNIVPCTNLSRGITTMYAFLGVPLMILVLADLGKLSTKAIKFIFLRVRRFHRTGTFSQKASMITDNKPLQYMTVSWRTVTPDPTLDTDSVGSQRNAYPKYLHNEVTTLTIHNDDLYKNLDFLNPDEKNHKHVEVNDDFTLPISLAIALVLIYMVVGGFLFSYWENWTLFEAFYFVFISMTTIGFGDYVPKNEDYMLDAFAYLVFGLMLTSMCINVIQEKLTVLFQKARVRIGNNTVLNVGALLEDEDHKSRAHQTPSPDLQTYEKCYGLKMTVHKDSNAAGRSRSQTNRSYLSVRADREEDSERFGKEMTLKVPSLNRFKFYDSPYSTFQGDTQKTIPSIHTARSYPNIRESICEDAEEEQFSKEMILKVPKLSQSYYYSPYSTFHGENQRTSKSLSTLEIPE